MNMIKICFICLGNICRSPMAEFVFKNLVTKENLQNNFYITSKGTSNEEQGNHLHPQAALKLKKHNIPYNFHFASQIMANEYNDFDYFIVMDSSNYRNLQRIFQNDKNKKIFKLLDFTDNSKDIADPWYTGNFDLTYKEIEKGTKALLNHLITKYKL